MVYGLQLYSKKLLVAFTSCVMMGIINMSQYKNIFIEFIRSFFAYNSYICQCACKPNLACAYMHMCSCKLSCIHLVCTQVLCTKAYVSLISSAHACIYVSEIKNTLCQVHGACVFIQFKLSCTVDHALASIGQSMQLIISYVPTIITGYHTNTIVKCTKYYSYFGFCYIYLPFSCQNMDKFLQIIILLVLYPVMHSQPHQVSFANVTRPRKHVIYTKYTCSYYGIYLLFCM